MKRCKFQGGQGLEEKYRPTSPCLVDFEPNSPNAKYCEKCRPFAKKWLSAQNANARYKAEPEKYAKITRENRWKRKKAAGRSVRRIGSMQRCEYPDQHEKRGEGCEINYKLESSGQKYCQNCQKLATRDTAKRSRKNHLADIHLRDNLRHKHEREQLAKIKTGELVEVDANAVLVPRSDAELIAKGKKSVDALKLATARSAEIRDAKQRKKFGRAVEETGLPLAARLLAAKAGLPKALRQNWARFSAAMCALGFPNQRSSAPFWRDSPIKWPWPVTSLRTPRGRPSGT
jgi:hypothetical protein